MASLGSPGINNLKWLKTCLSGGYILSVKKLFVEFSVDCQKVNQVLGFKFV